MTERPPKKDQDAEQSSVFGFLRPKEDQKKAKMVTVREEKKSLRRVLKPKPMSVKHMADTLETKKMSDRDIEITTAVLQNVTSAPAAPRQEKKPKGLNCYDCGAFVPEGALRCPKCNVMYLGNISDDDFDAFDEAAEELAADLEEFLNKEGSPVLHFDTESGVISYLGDRKGEADFVCECSHCGTLVAFDTDKCPICGTRLESGDTGLVSLFCDSEFASDAEDEMDCPLCGEHVMLQGGMCTKCKGQVMSVDPKDPSKKVLPVVKGDNVVFLHLDVESGELNYLQRLASKYGLEHVTVALEGIGKGGFEQDWKGLQRI
jgi:rubrerythrin